MPVRSLQLLDGKLLEFPQGGGEYTRKAMKLYNAMLKVFIDRNRKDAWF